MEFEKKIPEVMEIMEFGGQVMEIMEFSLKMDGGPSVWSREALHCWSRSIPPYPDNTRSNHFIFISLFNLEIN